MKKIGLFFILFCFCSSLLFAEDFDHDTYYSQFDEEPYQEDEFYSQNSIEEYPPEPPFVESQLYAENNTSYWDEERPPPIKKKNKSTYASRLPQRLEGYHEKVILINPRKHAWGAYSASGELLRSGLATAGSSWCPDIKRACRTRSGSFRIYSLGSSACVSKKYPLGKGGAPMPYCMFFNGHQGLHGSYQVVEGNVSHGCVRVRVSDAAWIRFNFATIGTKVIVTSY